MKFGQLIGFNNKNIFLQKLCRKWKKKTSSRPFFIFYKSFIWGKSKWSGAKFQYIPIALNLAYDKSKLYETLDYWSRDLLSFSFLEKSLGIVSPSHFVYDFSTEMFFILYSSNWQNFNDWLHLPLEILGNIYIAFVC